MISVIIPVYNTEKYITKCLDSVLAQTYTDFEVLIVDDGSTDGSLSICQEYAKKDDRIRVYHIDNHGVSYARNIGICKAKGEYLSFVDSDDWLDEKMYETLIHGVKGNGEDIAVCNTYYVKQDIPHKHIFISGSDRTVNGKEIDKLVLGYTLTLWNKLIGVSCCDSLLFNEELRYCEDADFLLRILPNIKELTACTQFLYFYHIDRDGNVVSRALNPRYYDYLNVMKLIIKRLLEEELYPEAMRRGVEVLRKIFKSSVHMEENEYRPYINESKDIVRLLKGKGRYLFNSINIKKSFWDSFFWLLTVININLGRRYAVIAVQLGEKRKRLI